MNENTSEIVHGTFILDSNRNIIAQEANELLLSEEEVRALAALYPEGIQATDDYNLLFAQSEINDGNPAQCNADDGPHCQPISSN